MTKFERDKVYKTRDGLHEVRVLCLDAPGTTPLIGVYVSGCNTGRSAERRADGTFGAASGFDLMLPKPEPIVEWGYMSGRKFEGATSECGARHFTSIIAGARLAKRTTEIVD